MLVGVEPEKVAVPVGTVPDDQLPPTFQLLPGPAQVASCACAGATRTSAALASKAMTPKRPLTPTRD